MRIMHMLCLAAGAAGIATIGLTGLGYYNSSSMLKDSNHILTDEILEPLHEHITVLVATDNAARELLNADRDAYQVLEAELSALMATEPERIEELSAAAEENMQQVHDQTRGSLGLSKDADLVQRFDAAFKQWQSNVRGVFEKKLAGDGEDLAASESVASRAETFNTMRGLIDKVSEGLESDVEHTLTSIEELEASSLKASEAMASRANKRLMTMLVLGIAIAAGVIGAIGPIAMFVTKRIKSVSDAMQSVASGKADLTLRVNDKGSDELAELSHWFDAIVDRFENLVVDVQTAVSDVSGRGVAMGSRAQEVQVQLESQAKGVHQTSAAVTELAASVEEIVERCKSVANTADESRQLSREGVDVVRKTIDAMNDITETFSVAGESIDKLSQNAEKIGSIIGVINDIAEQTNLLALNAAIESARAGEHGRGFAVVADEVRKLADRTTQATDEIATSIRDIQADTGGAVERMKFGSEQVTTGAERAQSAGTALESIEQTINRVAETIEGVASATTEQATATNEINREADQLSESSRVIGEAMSCTMHDIDAVRAASDSLSKLISPFRTKAAATNVPAAAAADEAVA